MTTIKRQRVFAYEERLFCGCGVEMLQCGYYFHSESMVRHFCPKCGETAKSDKSYPHIYYMPEVQHDLQIENIKVQNQPIPKRSMAPASWDLVMADIRARDDFGAKKYGERHQPHNGRDTMRDLYEELLDAVVYLRAIMFEKDGK